MPAPTLDFVIIGAPRAGTTTLFEYLRGHPEIALPAGKEAPFFASEHSSAMGWERYAAAMYPSDTHGLTVGKADPLYMTGGPARYLGPVTPEEDGWGVGTQPAAAPEDYVPQRIAAQFPDVKLIAILRDPVERALASHNLARLQQWDSAASEVRLSALLTPAALAWARTRPTFANMHVIAGEYGRLLQGYRRHFPAAQLWVTTTKRLSREPAAVLEECLAFLGVDQSYAPTTLGTAFNSAHGARRYRFISPYAVRGRLATSVAGRAVIRRLPDRQRHQLSQVTREMAYRVFLWNRRQADEQRQVISGELRARLRAHYEADRALLAELVGDTLAAGV